MGEEPRILAAWPRLLAVLSLHLTARSASEVQNCRFGVEQPFSDSANDQNSARTPRGLSTDFFASGFRGPAQLPLTAEGRRQAEAMAYAVWAPTHKVILREHYCQMSRGKRARRDRKADRHRAGDHRRLK